MGLTIVEHPLASHLLSVLRDASVRPDQFRRTCGALSTILILEATKTLLTEVRPVQTPLERTAGRYLAEGLTVVPILRAGLGMLESALGVFPDVTVGFVGIERHEDSALPRGYYCKLPSMSHRLTLCFDPMLATGGSACSALRLLREHGADHIVFVSIVSTPEGVARLAEEHPDVPIVTAALDRGLDERMFIVPGLGDFGDRLYGTS